jgi:hypothetical protein
VLLLAFKGLNKNPYLEGVTEECQWGAYSTYVEAFGVDGDTID